MRALNAQNTHRDDGAMPQSACSVKRRFSFSGGFVGNVTILPHWE
jgi:hypothetical protein